MAGASRCPAQRVAQRIFQGEAPGEIQMARAIERERGTVTSLMIGRVLFGVQVRKYFVCSLPV